MKTLQHILMIIILLVLTIGCARANKKYEIDPAFQVHFDSFKTESLHRGQPIDNINNLVIKFGNPGEAKGHCQFEDGVPTIEIDQADWQLWQGSEYFTKDGDKINPSHERLIFHELGHCVLDRTHDNAKSGIYPVSIMNEEFQESQSLWYATNREQLLDRLFQIK